MDSKPYAPRGLGAGGRRLWKQVLEHAELDPGQIRVLEDASRTADLIDELIEAQKGQPKMVKGSMGQQVASPMISEIRQHRMVLNALIKSLDLSRAQTNSAIEAAVTARLALEANVTDARERWADRKAKTS